MAVDPSDLNTQARIRNAALEAFARRGIAGTSIRDVARAADVSPGLVQHYFPSKAALREGVNDYVTAVVAGAFEQLPELPTGAARADELGRRITGIFREHPLALLYGARAVVEQDETALGLFDTFVALAEDQWTQAAADGLLAPDVDVRWAALQIVLYNLAAILFEPALDRHLTEPFLSDEGLDRWRRASTRLFERGVFNPARLRRRRR